MEELQRLIADPDVVLGAIRSDAQRALIVEIDAIVSLVEGYVDWVVDSIGARLLSTPRRWSARRCVVGGSRRTRRVGSSSGSSASS